MATVHTYSTYNAHLYLVYRTMRNAHPLAKPVRMATLTSWKFSWISELCDCCTYKVAVSVFAGFEIGDQCHHHANTSGVMCVQACRLVRIFSHC